MKRILLAISLLLAVTGVHGAVQYEFRQTFHSDVDTMPSNDMTGRAVIEVMGQRVTADTVVREAIPDRRLVLASSVSGMAVTASIELTPVDGGTRVTLTSEVKAESIFMAPLERLVADAGEKELEASLARLDAALAAGPET